MTARKNTPQAIRRNMSPEKRLQIDVMRSSDTDCWPWVGPINRWGYGRLRPMGSPELMMHRIAWSVHHGRPVPSGMVVRHSCDNPPCCNPAHLSIGLPQDNREDCVSRERHTFGVQCHSAILTPELVREARMRRRGGETYRELAARYSVSEVTIRRAVLGITWKQVLDPPQPRVTPKGLQKLLADYDKSAS
jgi:HNH endonuclease